MQTYSKLEKGEIAPVTTQTWSASYDNGIGTPNDVQAVTGVTLHIHVWFQIAPPLCYKSVTNLPPLHEPYVTCYGQHSKTPDHNQLMPPKANPSLYGNPCSKGSEGSPTLSTDTLSNASFLKGHDKESGADTLHKQCATCFRVPTPIPGSLKCHSPSTDSTHQSPLQSIKQFITNKSTKKPSANPATSSTSTPTRFCTKYNQVLDHESQPML
ncbi:hypothetical protein BS47DRAFT_1362345 [Hydnum rufescens UP504]|uniref:Uncharacterized protein n=1 Tax=Hydnum rufescens UP504 TaxID=1448309 RepID=A0A9P6AXC6_9AGAM|nr:hypothetical protein BS47DRAFT_1362345 [Hydnum rufescens UP504]